LCSACPCCTRPLAMRTVSPSRGDPGHPLILVLPVVRNVAPPAECAATAEIQRTFWRIGLSFLSAVHLILPSLNAGIFGSKRRLQAPEAHDVSRARPGRPRGAQCCVSSFACADPKANDTGDALNDPFVKSQRRPQAGMLAPTTDHVLSGPIELHSDSGPVWACLASSLPASESAYPPSTRSSQRGAANRSTRQRDSSHSRPFHISSRRTFDE